MLTGPHPRWWLGVVANAHPCYFRVLTYFCEMENPAVFHKFVNGFHVIRCTNQYWAGLGSDLVIEQTLMWSLKSIGGFTRGSGMTEHQRTVWTMSAPIFSAYNYAMQDFNNSVYKTSEQHKEATASRMEKNSKDKVKLSSKLEQYYPFSEKTTLRNIIRETNADEDVNIHDLFTIGKGTAKDMQRQSVFDYSYKRKSKVKTLASALAVQKQRIEPLIHLCCFRGSWWYRSLEISA